MLNLSEIIFSFLIIAEHIRQLFVCQYVVCFRFYPSSFALTACCVLFLLNRCLLQLVVELTVITLMDPKMSGEFITCIYGLATPTPVDLQLSDGFTICVSAVATPSRWTRSCPVVSPWIHVCWVCSCVLIVSVFRHKTKIFFSENWITVLLW